MGPPEWLGRLDLYQQLVGNRPAFNLGLGAQRQPPLAGQSRALLAFDRHREHAKASERVITIGTALPSAATPDSSTVEQWNDVPAASVDYAAARAALKAHVEDLIDRMSREAPTDR